VSENEYAMKTTKRIGYGLGAVVALIAVASHSSWANDKNFKNAADNRGCDSIITRDGISECKQVQGVKNTACNRASTCELDKQESWAKDYDGSIGGGTTMAKSYPTIPTRAINSARCATW
jgi:uncharacterized membrane protein